MTNTGLIGSVGVSNQLFVTDTLNEIFFGDFEELPTPAVLGVDVSVFLENFLNKSWVLLGIEFK